MLRDADGRPVRGASIAKVVSMPAMGAMPYMESRGRVSGRGGVYVSRYGLSMGGGVGRADRRDRRGGRGPGRPSSSTSLKGVAFDIGTPAAGGATNAAPRLIPAGVGRRQSGAATDTLPGVIAR